MHPPTQIRSIENEIPPLILRALNYVTFLDKQTLALIRRY